MGVASPDKPASRRDAVSSGTFSARAAKWAPTVYTADSPRHNNVLHGELLPVAKFGQGTCIAANPLPDCDWCLQAASSVTILAMSANLWSQTVGDKGVDMLRAL